MPPLHCVTRSAGQILLVSVIVIGAISLIIAGSLIFLRLGLLQGATVTQQAAKASALNNACAERALDLLRQSADFTGSGSLSLVNETCNFNVEQIDDGADCPAGDDDCSLGRVRVVVSSVVKTVSRKTRIYVTLDRRSPLGSQITVVSWKDIP